MKCLIFSLGFAWCVGSILVLIGYVIYKIYKHKTRDNTSNEPVRKTYEWKKHTGIIFGKLKWDVSKHNDYTEYSKDLAELIATNEVYRFPSVTGRLYTYKFKNMGEERYIKSSKYENDLIPGVEEMGNCIVRPTSLCERSKIYEEFEGIIINILAVNNGINDCYVFLIESENEIFSITDPDDVVINTFITHLCGIDVVRRSEPFTDHNGYYRGYLLKPIPNYTAKGFMDVMRQYQDE